MANVLTRTLTDYVYNNSGGTLVKGDVIIMDGSTNFAITTTTTSGYKNGKVGVVLSDSVANGAWGFVAWEGEVPKINLNTSANRLDLVKCHSIAKQGTPHAAPLVAGDFAQVRETGSTPSAVLFGHVEQGSAVAATIPASLYVFMNQNFK